MQATSKECAPREAQKVTSMCTMHHQRYDQTRQYITAAQPPDLSLRTLVITTQRSNKPGLLTDAQRRPARGRVWLRLQSLKSLEWL